MGLVFKKCSLVFTGEGFLSDVDVELSDDGTLSVGRGLGEGVDCRGLAAVPGFANVHTHLAHAYAGPPSGAGASWESHHSDYYPREAAEALVELGLLDALSTGTTLVVDTSTWPDIVTSAARSLGVRALVAVPWERHPRKGYHVLLQSPDISEDAASEVRGFLEREASALLFVHAATSRSQVYSIKRRYGRFPVEHLDSLGLLTERTVLLSPGWASSWELHLIGKRGAKLAYAPLADMYTASGGALPHAEVAGAGVGVAVCSESPLLGLTLDMLEAAKVHFLAQRALFWDRAYSLADALRAATEGGYRALGLRGGWVGGGAAADVVFYRLRHGGVREPERALFNLSGGDVVYVACGGRIVYSPELRERLLERRLSLLEKLRDYGFANP